MINIRFFTTIILAGSLFTLTACSTQPESRSPKKEAESRRLSGPIIDTDLSSQSQHFVIPEDDPKALANLAEQYFGNKRFKEAVDTYLKILKLTPDNVDIYNDLGLAYFYLGQQEKSVEALEKGTAVMPGYQRIWLSLGFVQLASGDKKKAEIALSQAVELDSSSKIGQEAQRMLGLAKEMPDAG
ncbi:MAG: tetratricopeptide repeat protein [Nitrospira sp.]|nr:tetratricopeptide repeat protein [bacterium]MBL7048550.1 tetratricopeptide repeat protein [Nitrospira sp.]